MEKPFDVQDLLKRLETKGVVIAESAAKVVVGETLSWVEESVLLTPNKVDDLAVPGIEAVKPFVMSQIDKIDGVQGN